MLYVFHGDNVNESIRKRASLLADIARKKPNAYRQTVEGALLSEELLEDMLGRMGLLEALCVFILDGAMAEQSSRGLIVSRAGAMSASPNVFIVFERFLLVDKLINSALAALPAATLKIYQSKGLVKQSTRNSGLFYLTDLLGRRARRELWVEYTKAREGGVSAEEIHGILFWQAKAMALAGAEKSAKAAGLSPFVYSKSRKYADNWGAEEVRKLLSSLITCYHRSRRGLSDLDLSLERVILCI
jgi:hypothetical protein